MSRRQARRRPNQSQNSYRRRPDNNEEVPEYEIQRISGIRRINGVVIELVIILCVEYELFYINNFC